MALLILKTQYIIIERFELHTRNEAKTVAMRVAITVKYSSPFMELLSSTKSSSIAFPVLVIKAYQ